MMRQQMNQLRTAYATHSFIAMSCIYSGLTLNQYGVASPCRTICTVCGFVALS
ncbi:hypothetical protein [Neisseria sicca]|uniref:hypothetical protein n=1 Tax=Neisseria sicca TaxID=490 RepID=UPI0037CB9552